VIAYAPGPRRDDLPPRGARIRTGAKGTFNIVLNEAWGGTMSDERLGISEVAAQTGVAAGTIRMWEQRYGFPQPRRTPSGYRLYGPDDVEALRRVQALRRRGLSAVAAV
jgi:MerR HTH family regulatory protein